MYINSDLTELLLTNNNKSIFITYKDIIYRIDDGMSNWTEAKEFYNAVRRIDKYNRAFAIETGAIKLPSFITGEAPTEVEPAPEKSKEEILLEGMTALLDFFTEFDFTPSYRFTNTLAYLAPKATKAKGYINNYFELMGSSYTAEVSEKIKSKEFSQILKNISQYGEPSSRVNNRFKVYFGAAGTGKTTLAQNEAENRCIVCNSSMLPSDLMENFVFTDGKPDFNPSMLWECMEQGKAIVMDEINLLPFDSLRFLQGIADGKQSFLYKNREVHIKDGFKIIGTMNLTLGGVTYGLPEPLVDRCEDIREFKLSPEQLMGAITGNFVGA